MDERVPLHADVSRNKYGNLVAHITDFVYHYGNPIDLAAGRERESVYDKKPAERIQCAITKMQRINPP